MIGSTNNDSDSSYHGDFVPPGSATAIAELAARWSKLRALEPRLRIRDAAVRLGTTELELLATQIATTATWLTSDFKSILQYLPAVGRCMALTRNDCAVSEVRGRYGGIDLGPHAGQVIGEGIDLRVFLSQWRYGLAVLETDPAFAHEQRRSLHFFDRHGVAVHKVYLQPEGDRDAWDDMVRAHRAKLAPQLDIDRALPPEQDVGSPSRGGATAASWAESRDSLGSNTTDQDRAAFLAAWDAMKDTHEFFQLLRHHRVTRTQALLLAGPQRARRVGNDSLHQVLRRVAVDQFRIMTFIGNRGCLQIFSGSVERVTRSGPWLNVLDTEHNLHLREDRISTCWEVRKPTRSGIVSSLELYDDAGETIALVFRKRDDREAAEDPRWSQLLSELAGVP